MGWKKVSPEVAVVLEKAIEPFDCLKRTMFGYPAFFVNNNMWTGVFEDRIFIRLSARDRERIFSAETEAVVFQPMTGRAMKEYVELPPSLYKSADFGTWLKRSYDYVSSLAPKEPKGLKPKN